MTPAKTYAVVNAVVDEGFVKSYQHGITLKEFVVQVQNEQLQCRLQKKQQQQQGTSRRMMVMYLVAVVVGLGLLMRWHYSMALQ